MARLAGKAAVVTGASRGIGAAIARRLAADGAAVVVNYHQNAEAAAQVVAQIEAAGGAALTAQADLADLETVSRLVGAALARFGRLDILVNNAGVGEYRPLEQIDVAHYERVFAVNVRGLLWLTREAAQHMTTGGRVINISSGAVRAAPPGASVYSASKAAVETMTQCLAAELGPRGMTVNAVAPGLTATDMLQEVMPPEAQQALVGQTPLGRLGQPEDIADVVAFLASDDARWITGQVIGVGGGLR